MVVDVLVEIKKLDKTFSYLVPKNMEKDITIGKRCVVPFNKRTLEGFIVSYNNKEINYELKEIISIIDEDPILNEELLELGNYISKKTLSTKINAYQTMLPTAFKAKNNFNMGKKTVFFIKKIKDFTPLNEKEKLLYDLLQNDIPLKEVNISTYYLNKLINKGYLEKYKKEVYKNDFNEIVEDKKVLTIDQQNVINKIDLDSFMPYLLHGVTGSGKTEVYIQIIKKVIEKNKKVILLVPEISLTPQIVDKFRKRFGNVAILHSGLSNREKYDEYRKIQKNEVSIVIGARSAIFAPLSNIGLIVIDEEHSDTYKQENTPMYNTIDIALFRCKKNNCPLLLGSATPSIESYTRAKNNIYKLLEMKNRVNNKMPKIFLVDMKEEIKNKNKIFSSILKEKINDRLNKKEQIIILLNRRGYTTITTCSNCGYVHKCPRCDIPLTYHLKTYKMHCHYCNYETNRLKTCPICKSTDIHESGMGTEKLEQELHNEFKDARIVRMDIDTTRNKNSHKKIIEDFENLKYDILVGTQMIAKGLDFPLVSLVGVINADATLMLPDFRSAERTFQLINQVSGRAGRSDIKGEVVLQAFNINHYSLQYSKNNDYLSFYNKEMAIRKILKYPPFYNLCLIKIQGVNSLYCENECEKIYIYLKEHIQDIILGPSLSAIPKINNTYYYQIIIKYKDTKKIYKYLKYVNDMYINNSKIKVSIDFNPNRI